MDIISYPSPEITVNKISSLDDISKLGASAKHSGVVYLYVDSHNLSVYVGESKSSAMSRYSSTHKNSSWIADMLNPVVFAFFGTNKSWDTDSRRAIEGCLIHDFSERGFNLANRSQLARPEFHSHFGLGGKEIEDIVAVVNQYVDFEVGYRRSEAGLEHCIDFSNVAVRSSEGISSEVFEAVKYVYGSKSSVGSTVWGVRRASDGWVKIVKAVGIPSSPKVYSSDTDASLEMKIARNEEVKRVSERQPDGTYSYLNSAGMAFGRPTGILVGFLGRGVSNRWVAVDESLWESEVGFKLSYF